MYHERVADNFVQKNSSLAKITVSMKVAYYFFKRKSVRQYVFTGVALLLRKYIHKCVFYERVLLRNRDLAI